MYERDQCKGYTDASLRLVKMILFVVGIHGLIEW